MYKIQIFSGYTGEVKKEADVWFKEHPNIVVHSQQTSMVPGNFVLTILYEENTLPTL